jgi:P-type Ca2+ transporter type 2C
MAQVRDELEAANPRCPSRVCVCWRSPSRFLSEDELDAAVDDPMAYVTDLVLVSLVGIIDPLRAEAKDAVSTSPCVPVSTSA